MKKNLALTLAIIVLVALFVSCASNNGTYYLYENGERSGESFITIKDDEWTDNDGASGRVEIENDKITFYTVVFGSEEANSWQKQRAINSSPSASYQLPSRSWARTLA